jgi:hypothetical protein
MFIVYLSYIYPIFIVYLSYVVDRERVGFFVSLVERIFGSPPLGTRRGGDFLSAGSFALLSHTAVKYN